MNRANNYNQKNISIGKSSIGILEHLLPDHNGVLFFDIKKRRTETLYTDECVYKLGRLSFEGF